VIESRPKRELELKTVQTIENHLLKFCKTSSKFQNLLKNIEEKSIAIENSHR
jgi:hypothetical protein